MALYLVRVDSVSFVLMAIVYSLILFQTRRKSLTLNLILKGRAVSAADLPAIKTH